MLEPAPAAKVMPSIALPASLAIAVKAVTRASLIAVALALSASAI